MTAQVITMKPQSVNALITQAKAAWDRADEKRADADQWYARTGKILVELKARVKEEGGRWLPTLKKLGRSQRRAHELMQLAGGEITIEHQRERTRKAMRKSRARAKKSASRDAEKSVPDATPEPEGDPGDDQLEERWQNSLANFFGDIIAREAFLDRQFPGWREFECPSHILTLMRDAATAFASLTKAIKRS